jgi:hypothetical protein
MEKNVERRCNNLILRSVCIFMVEVLAWDLPNRNMSADPLTTMFGCGRLSEAKYWDHKFESCLGYMCMPVAFILSRVSRGITVDRFSFHRNLPNL